jgi:hypothetical protein
VVIAYEFVSDLCVLGFTDTTIAKGSTRLTRLIGEYVDMESLVLNGVLLPRKHENGLRSSEASQLPTVHEQIVQNPWEVTLVGGRSQDQHLNSRQVIESAMNPISVSRALVATTTTTATTTTIGPEPKINTGVPSDISLPGTQAPIQPDQSFHERPPTSIEPPANEHRAASRAATPANSFKHRLALGAHSARKMHKTGNEDVPTLYSDTPPAILAGYFAAYGDDGKWAASIRVAHASYTCWTHIPPVRATQILLTSQADRLQDLS